MKNKRIPTPKRGPHDKKEDLLPRQRDALHGAKFFHETGDLPGTVTPETILNREKEKRLANALLPLILTPLEYEVVEGFLDGFSRKAIAEKLEITIADVVEIKTRALEKIKSEFPAVLQDYERRLYSHLRDHPRRNID